MEMRNQLALCGICYVLACLVSCVMECPAVDFAEVLCAELLSAPLLPHPVSVCLCVYVSECVYVCVCVGFVCVC